MLTKAPRGTVDILPGEVHKWRALEAHIFDICRRYGYNEIRTPVFEHTELFERGMGDTTDVVQKEMYTFTDKGGRSITLRPEGTAGVARAFAEHNLGEGMLPAKLCYAIACYRYEKPQAGRLREFHQFGAECFGTEEPYADAETIAFAWDILNSLSLPKIRLNVNSIGCPECRSRYNSELKAYFEKHLGELCETCNARYDRNPLRILDCKSGICKSIAQNAPHLIDFVCAKCKDHFEKVCGYLSEMEIPFNIDPTMVRGLDYYTKTVFEFKSALEGTQGTVAGGGRYDNLVSEIGGKDVPGIGFAMGMERIILAMEAAGAEIAPRQTPDIFIANAGSETDAAAAKITHELRALGVAALRECCGRSLKAQMKQADKCGAKYSAVLGTNETQSGEITLRDMESGQLCAVELSAEAIAQYVKRELA